MLEFKAVTRKWGNSLGITLPNNIIKKANIKPDELVEIFIPEKNINLKRIFGTLKFKKSAQEIKDELREGWEPEH